MMLNLLLGLDSSLNQGTTSENQSEYKAQLRKYYTEI